MNYLQSLITAKLCFSVLYHYSDIIDKKFYFFEHGYFKHRMGVSASKVASYSYEFSDVNSVSQSNYRNYQIESNNQQMDDNKITVRYKSTF